MNPPSPFASLLQSSKIVLKHRSKKPLFSNITNGFQFDEKKSPIACMRYIDTLRYHKPTDSERMELNVCSATERLNLHTLNDILTICGARKGARFQSHDIQRMIQLEKELVQLYEKLETQDILDFKMTANQYLNLFKSLKNLVKELKQTTGTLALGPDPEFEVKAKHPYPGFLMTLIQCYHSGKSTTIDSMARFACFLSFLLYTKMPLTTEERQSMDILLQIIKWTTHFTQCACAKAIWQFLCTVRELRAVPKDQLYFTKTGHLTNF